MTDRKQPKREGTAVRLVSCVDVRTMYLRNGSNYVLRFRTMPPLILDDDVYGYYSGLAVG